MRVLWVRMEHKVSVDMKTGEEEDMVVVMGFVV